MYYISISNQDFAFPFIFLLFWDQIGQRIYLLKIFEHNQL
jgi:hypothetical protein